MVLKKEKHKKRKPALKFRIYRNGKSIHGKSIPKKLVPAYSEKQAISFTFYKTLKGKKNRGDIAEYEAIEVKRKSKKIQNGDDDKISENDLYEFPEPTCNICGYSDPAGPGHRCPNCGEN